MGQKKDEGDRPPRGRPAGDGRAAQGRGDAERARLAVVQEVLARHEIERPLGGGELRRRAAEAAVLDLPGRYLGSAREQVAEWRGVEARLESRRPAVLGLGGVLGRMVGERLGGGRVGGSGAVGQAVGARVQTAVGNPWRDDGPGPELQVARAHLAVLGGQVINRLLMDEASGGQYLAAEAARDKARDEGLAGPLPHGAAPNLVVDINSVPPQVLTALPMVGPTLARAIVAARLERPFSDLADFNRRVKGVGPGTLALLAPYLRFDGGGSSGAGEPVRAGQARWVGAGWRGRVAARGVWLDVLAGQRPGLLGGLSAADVPLKSIDEALMVGSDYVPREDGPEPPRPDQAAVEAAAALDKARDWRLRPEGDLERGALPDVETHGAQLRDDGFRLFPLFTLGRIPNDPIATAQAKLAEKRRRWAGVGIGHGRVVDPKLARQGLASAGSTADRVWLDVLAGTQPRLLGGMAAWEVPMKPAAVEAPPAGGSGGGEHEEV